MPPLLLLYAIAMEPLAATLRQCYAEQGLNYQERCLIVSMYVDDVVVYMRHPDCNTNPLIQEFIHFGGFSGVVINWAKSYIFPLTTATGKFRVEYPMQWVESSV